MNLMNFVKNELKSDLSEKELNFLKLEDIRLTRMDTTLEFDFRIDLSYNLDIILRLINLVGDWIVSTNFTNYIFKFNEIFLMDTADLLKIADTIFYRNFNISYNTKLIEDTVVILFETNEEELNFKTSKAKKRFETFYRNYGFNKIMCKHNKEVELKKNIQTLSSGENNLYENRDSKAAPTLNATKAYFASPMESSNTPKYKIEDLPFNQEEVDSFEEHIIEITGEIFNVEVKETKKCNIVIYSLTDFFDSIEVKQIISKSKVDTTTVYKVGETITVKGEVKYDTFSRDVLVNVVDNCVYVSDEVLRHSQVFDDQKDLRTELHCHTKMSAHDGLTDVEDYFKNASKYGIKALAITDHENVQAFPDEVVTAKNSGIKAIYGCEFNAYDENDFKIVYDDHKTESYDVVGLDIETTGLSNQYDDIIEISAYKVKGGVKSEYSVIVKCDISKMSSKIVELTTITPEMIENEGIDLKEALEGFVAFVGDDYIVAHNANFDIPFMEEKIRNVLGIEKHYNYIDTLNFAKVVLKNELRRFTLDSVAKKVGVSLEQHHRAIYDAQCCYEIYYALMDRINIKRFDIKKDIVEYPCVGTVKYSTYKKELELRKLLTEANIIKMEETAEEVHKEEEGYFLVKTNQDFIDDWMTSVERHDFDMTVDDGVYKIGYKDSATKKLIAKLKTRKGAKKNVESFELVITQEENKGAKGTITIEIESKEALALVADYGLKETIKTNPTPYVINTLNTLYDPYKVQEYVKPFHLTALVKNQKGLKNLFKLVSLAHTNFLGRNPQIPLRILDKYHEGILFGTSCVNGLFNVAFNKNFSEFIKRVEFYDYVELQPYNCYVSISDTRDQKDDIISTIQKIGNYCTSIGKTVVVDSDAHYLLDEQKEYRDYYINTPMVGGGTHPLKGRPVGIQRLMTTSELINEYSKYFNSEIAYKYVVTNTNLIADMIDDNITVIHDKLYTPTDDFLANKVLDVVGHTVPSVKEELSNICNKEVQKYAVNGVLPPLVQKRLDKELKSIIGNGFQVTYYIAYLLVKKSNSDGYIVGSRGSVGSSFVANLMGITEVNALAPHYYCPHCHFSRFKLNDDEKKEYGYADDDIDKTLQSVDDGFDLPDMVCPVCGRPLHKDGHDIPFETFLGFNGDKVPDIDLNFSSDYQWQAHNFCKTVFGADHAFRAGTTSTVAEKTAFGIVKSASEREGKRIRNCEADRRAKQLEGVKHTTGQHPGGIIVIPANFDVLDFTPVQYPANTKGDWLTTHFDFHKIHDNVLKLDILGHDDPTVLKYLMDYVYNHQEEFPFRDVKDIPLDDREVYQLLYPNDKGEIHSLAIPEFGTNFVGEMLKDTQPKTFAQLVKISGLSHGTDVWLGNAQDLVNGKSGFEKIPFANIIGCRDDIMVDLMYMGLNPSKAFEIMEFVRKGKPSKEKDKWKELKAYMRENNVPEWYIWSCEKIKYMFPKAHAVAYVLSAMRIAWFKVHKPLLFYSAWFSIRADKIDLKTILDGKTAIDQKIADVSNNKDASDIEEAQVDVLKVVSEAYERGIIIERPDLNKSDSKYFVIDETQNCLIAPFSAIDGLGEAVGKTIVDERQKGRFESIDDFMSRMTSKKIRQAVIDFDMTV